MKNIENDYPSSTAAAENLYDLSLLEEMEDNEYTLDVLNVLLSETPKDLKEMKIAVQSGRADIVSQQAHKLKSSAGIIQANKFTSLLVTIESMAKNGFVSNELVSMVENAMIQYRQIENALKLHMVTLK